jgi:hypothetical protein
MWSAPCDFTISTARTDALFASTLQCGHEHCHAGPSGHRRNDPPYTWPPGSGSADQLNRPGLGAVALPSMRQFISSGVCASQGPRRAGELAGVDRRGHRPSR